MHAHPFPHGRTAILATALSAALFLTACSDTPKPVASAPKPVKTEVVATVGANNNQLDSFVGTLRARQRSQLGFEAAGRVTQILVEVGDRVRAGQVLARMDEAPARWRLDKAQADHSAAVTALAERRAQLEQQEALARDKIISPTALASARTAHQQAQSQRDGAEAALATARRDLALTRITAPFDGEIVARTAQPFSDVAPGQALLQIQAGRVLEVVTMLPDTLAASLTPGTKATAVSGSASMPLVLERLSDRSDNGALVQAIFRVQQAPASVRSGGVVSVELSRRGGATATNSQPLTLPASAVMPAAQQSQAHVFVLTPAGTLRLRPVQIGADMLPGGRLLLTKGLAAGERVVVAGTAFLREGQAAVPYEAQTLLQERAR